VTTPVRYSPLVDRYDLTTLKVFFATQNVVEKMLWKMKQQTRCDVGRTKFVELAQGWKVEYHKKITNAFRKMGSSLDWTREVFTMVRIPGLYPLLQCLH